MKKFNIVESWLANVQYSHSKSVNTANRYKRELKAFCGFIDKTPQQILDEYNDSTDRNFKRKYALYLRGLIAEMSRKGYAPNSINSAVIAVKSFFKYNDLPLGHVPVAKVKVVFHNRDITKDEVKQILEVSRPRDKAAFAVLAQSGLRPDVLCKLRFKHIEEEFKDGVVPMKIDVPAEISKGQYGGYFTFIGEEAVKHLKAYLLTRPNIQPNDYLFASYGSKKPLNPKSLSKIFNHTIRKLEKKGTINEVERRPIQPTRDKGIKRELAELRLYNLRKYFRKEAGKAGIEYVNFWMGHKVNYKAPHIPSSDQHYFPKEDVEFQRRLYAEKAAPFLRIETPTPTETEKTIEELRAELRAKTTDVKGLMDKMSALEGRMKAYEAFTKKFLDALPEELEELGKAILKKRLTESKEPLRG